MLAYHANTSLALTYAMRHPKLARECAIEAICASIEMRRPDLTAAANELLCAILAGGK